ncbi:hypothetical protein [Nocardia sp. NPDC047038]|uniref:hypothetical protein n=1 Tax=Nocardia sp. NPDC047038 TaxID=3154338 RepID=UPI0033E19314
MAGVNQTGEDEVVHGEASSAFADDFLEVVLVAGEHALSQVEDPLHPCDVDVI